MRTRYDDRRFRRTALVGPSLVGVAAFPVVGVCGTVASDLMQSDAIQGDFDLSVAWPRHPGAQRQVARTAAPRRHVSHATLTAPRTTALIVAPPHEPVRRS